MDRGLPDRFTDFDRHSQRSSSRTGNNGNTRCRQSVFRQQHTIAWVNEQGMRFYAYGTTPTHNNANASLYALYTSIICSMGFLPHLGFMNKMGTLPFDFDIADIYKSETTLEATFQALSLDSAADEAKSLVIHFLQDRGI